MKIDVIATTKPSNKTAKDEFNMFSGHCAGICYMANDFETILTEDTDKTKRRITQTMTGGHHSVFDHNYITLYLEEIPKLLAMLLNNEKMYTTSEKSARYTKMKPSPEEETLYNKWMEIFEKEIAAKYPQMNEKKVAKLAQENARYLISVMTPTTMVYTVSYRQINYIYKWTSNMLETNSENKIINALKPHLLEFKKSLEDTGYIEERLKDDNKSRTFSLFAGNQARTEYFGDVYCTTYKGSFAEFAQAQRHRTLNYAISALATDEFFVPPIIKGKSELVAEWEKDIKSVANLLPQGMLISICERGTYENFVLKLKERLCTNAQLEIAMQSKETLTKYAKELESSNHPLAEDIKKYLKGARCTFKDFTCTADCAFAEGKTLTRLI